MTNAPVMVSAFKMYQPGTKGKKGFRATKKVKDEYCLKVDE